MRKKCLPRLLAQGWLVKFIVGRPSEDLGRPQSLEQGQKATPWEIDLAQNLTREANEHKDIFFAPSRDHYRDTSDKVYNILLLSQLANARHAIKVDDDFCPRVSTLRRIDETTTGTSARYIGENYFNGNEYAIMRGADHRAVPFFSGHGYVLSSPLVRAVLECPDAVLFAAYGTSSEDKNTGSWVERAALRHENDPCLTFTAEEVPHLITRVLAEYTGEKN